MRSLAYILYALKLFEFKNNIMFSMSIAIVMVFVL